MKLPELKNALAQNTAAYLRFLLPNGELTPAHSHVTEVARVDKRFIDCGGTLRTDSLCRLQTWSADDVDHRLTASKLLKILNLAESILRTDDLEIDVEHEVGFISQFPLEAVEAKSAEIILRLGVRHTACLAMDKCGVAPAEVSATNPLKFNFREPAAKCCA